MRYRIGVIHKAMGISGRDSLYSFTPSSVAFLWLAGVLGGACDELRTHVEKILGPDTQDRFARLAAGYLMC